MIYDAPSHPYYTPLWARHTPAPLGPRTVVQGRKRRGMCIGPKELGNASGCAQSMTNCGLRVGCHSGGHAGVMGRDRFPFHVLRPWGPGGLIACGHYIEPDIIPRSRQPLCVRMAAAKALTLWFEKWYRRARCRLNIAHPGALLALKVIRFLRARTEFMRYIYADKVYYYPCSPRPSAYIVYVVGLGYKPRGRLQSNQYVAE